jgi:hypothetical protein
MDEYEGGKKTGITMKEKKKTVKWKKYAKIKRRNDYKL